MLNKVTPEQEQLREKSGNVTSDSKLTRFIYLLTRDHLPMGTVSEILNQCIKDDKISQFTNGWLAEYAKDVSEKLFPNIMNVSVGPIPVIKVVDQEMVNKEVDRVIKEYKFKFEAAIDRLIDEFEKVRNETKESLQKKILINRLFDSKRIELNELKSELHFLETVVLKRLRDIRETYSTPNVEKIDTPVIQADTPNMNNRVYTQESFKSAAGISDDVSDKELEMINNCIKNNYLKEWMRANKAEWGALVKIKNERNRMVSIIDKYVGFDKAALASQERAMTRGEDYWYCLAMITNLKARIQVLEELKKEFLDGMNEEKTESPRIPTRHFTPNASYLRVVCEKSYDDLVNDKDCVHWEITDSRYPITCVDCLHTIRTKKINFDGRQCKKCMKGYYHRKVYTVMAKGKIEQFFSDDLYCDHCQNRHARFAILESE